MSYSELVWTYERRPQEELNWVERCDVDRKARSGCVEAHVRPRWREARRRWFEPAPLSQELQGGEHRGLNQDN